MLSSKKMCIVSCTIGMPNMKKINMTVIEISQKTSHFENSLRDEV